MLQITRNQYGEIILVRESNYSIEYVDGNIDDFIFDPKGVFFNKELSYSERADIYKYIVNITTENKKKKATIIESNQNDSVELDFDRGDRGFNTIKEAQEYADTFNL